MIRRVSHGCARAAALGVVATLAYAWAYVQMRWRPATASLDQGWWQFADQGRYLRSTLAWAAGKLDPAEHWYLPGYPLLGVPFVRLTPANPFLLPNLVLLLLSMWLLAEIAGRLAPAWSHARLAGALAFLATSVLPPYVLDVWIIPWTSTPETALTLGAVLATLALLERPGWRPALVASLCSAAIAAFRPADAATISAVCGTAILVRLAADARGRAASLRVVAASLIGGTATLATVAALYWTVNGWHLSEYVRYSLYIGFEWRLLPLQWVQIVLDPRPLLPEAGGLVTRMPWIVPGLAGMVACLRAPPLGGTRRAHALLVGLAAAHMVQYLAYRDLHPQGLWRYQNYHYFKWLYPVFGWYSVLLAMAILRRSWAGPLAGAAALVLLLPWRAELSPVEPALPVQPGREVTIPAGLGVRDALLVPATGTWDAIYHGTHSYTFGDHGQVWLGAVGRIAAYPLPGGLILAPLAPLPPGPGRVVFDAGVLVRGDQPVRLARQDIVFGVPCFLSSRLLRLDVCRTPMLMP